MVPPMPPWGLDDCNPGFPAWPVFGLKGQSKRTGRWTAERPLLASGDELGVARSGACNRTLPFLANIRRQQHPTGPLSRPRQLFLGIAQVESQEVV